MKRINTNCKFCDKPVWMDCDEDGLIFLDESIWIKKIACDRCSDYRVSLRKIEASVYSACQLLRGCRFNMNGEARIKVESLVREKLDTLTKRIATLACDYFRVANQWERDFTDQIFEHPMKASVVIGIYLRGIRSFGQPEQP